MPETILTSRLPLGAGTDVAVAELVERTLTRRIDLHKVVVVSPLALTHLWEQTLADATVRAGIALPVVVTTVDRFVVGDVDERTLLLIDDEAWYRSRLDARTALAESARVYAGAAVLLMPRPELVQAGDPAALEAARRNQEILFGEALPAAG